MPDGLYVESRIRVGMDELWSRTRQPGQHQRWDLRFTEIRPVPGALPEGPARFRYATRVLPGLVIAGTGIAAGERCRPDGTRTSVLRFRSAHPLSPLAEGSGYWRYVPVAGGGGTGEAVRFLTGYDYTPRWGRFGRPADRFVFRPLMGWATAWSFDRLRIWCEYGVTPERAMLRALGEAAARLAAVGLASGWAGTLAGAAVALLALFLPPLPRTPAARRCLRRAPGLRASRAAGRRSPRQPAPPALLTTLEQP